MASYIARRKFLATLGEQSCSSISISRTPGGHSSLFALQSRTSLNSSSLVRALMGNPPAGRSHWIGSSSRPRATMWWLELDYASRFAASLFAIDALRCLFC